MKCSLKIITLLVIMLSAFEIKAQVDVLSHTWVSGYYVGWSSSHDIDFKINGGQPMIIKTTGNVGIGTTAPSERFQVAGGNIDLTVTGHESYMLNSEAVLWNNNTPNSSVA